MIGEHIRALKDGRWTHAIDCGDETVIHLAEDDPPPSRVRRSYRPQFIAGAEVVEVVRHRERTFPANEIVARAYSRISEPGLSATLRDSEAFAEWCVTGRASAAPPRGAPSGAGPTTPPVAVRAGRRARAAPGGAAKKPKPARPAKTARPASGRKKAGPPRGKKARASARAGRRAGKTPRAAPRKRARRGR